MVAIQVHQHCTQPVAGLQCHLMTLCVFALQHLAALYVLAVGMLGVLTHCAVATIPFVVCGALSAWVYLRFYQPSPTDASQQCACCGL